MKFSCITISLVDLFVWLFLGISFFANPAFCGPTKEDGQCIFSLENGSINWSTGTVTAAGRAGPRINKDNIHEADPGSARADANRQLIDIMKQIRIHHDMKVGAYAAQNDVILAGIEKTAPRPWM